MRLVLASASPRRRDLLGRLGVDFAVVPPDVLEDNGADAGDRPERVARRLATAKTRAAASLRPDAVVLAADTVVWYRGALLGKPRDAAEARAHLRRLSGRTHRVVTAVAVAAPGRRLRVAHARTLVRLRRYADDEIETSIARGDPFDKAGAYAIQDAVLSPVERYEGCYCNVVGLPLWTAARLLGEAGVGVGLEALPEVCQRCPLRPVSMP